MSNSIQQLPIILIGGPTASGKSRLALDMAKDKDGIVINADSQQLYADMDVLSARPPAEDEAMAPHRLYGVADAAEAWSVGKWSRAALDEITRAHAMGKAAILVGGTGLYFNALTKGLADIPPVPAEVRDVVEQEYVTVGEESFRQTLRTIDAVSEAKIFPSDRQRLIRALSVHRATGQSLSDYINKTQPLLAPDSWTGIVVAPERDALYANCDRRVDIMMQTGAVEEVKALMARGLDIALPAMKAVGLREIAAWLNGSLTREQAVADMKQATRNYAKRQLTWFRNQQSDWARHRP